MSIKKEVLFLLKTLISLPSFSREEAQTAEAIVNFFSRKSIPVNRLGHNVWVKSRHWHDEKPTILLNSHHDTVRPVAGWTRNPFQPDIEKERLYGLGSNDAGASLVALLACFLHFYEQEHLGFNLLFAATAEEEISGKNGIASIVPQLGEISAGIIGEPTQMRMAIAEKGLMVIDGQAQGKAGHAAREEGINALYLALQDIERIRQFDFDRVSTLLGKTKATVTQIEAGTQHNVVPDSCNFVIDVRTNEEYSNQEVFELLQNAVESHLQARSFRLNSSKIDLDHPLVKAGLEKGFEYYGSPTLSDQALLSFPTVKIGCGKSARSHTADEFILLEEVDKGIDDYIRLLNQYQNLSRSELKKAPGSNPF